MYISKFIIIIIISIIIRILFIFLEIYNYLAKSVLLGAPVAASEVEKKVEQNPLNE